MARCRCLSSTPISISPITRCEAARSCVRRRNKFPTTKGFPRSVCRIFAPGHVGLICAAIYCQPALPGIAGYRTADEACAMAQRHLGWLRQQDEAGEIALVRSPQQVPDGNSSSGGKAIPTIMLLEGADPIRTIDDVADWFGAGLRMVGMAWEADALCRRDRGGPARSLADGVRLVRELDQWGIIHDVSHLAEESFWQLLDLSRRPGGCVSFQLPRNHSDGPATLRSHGPRDFLPQWRGRA